MASSRLPGPSNSLWRGPLLPLPPESSAGPHRVTQSVCRGCAPTHPLEGPRSLPLPLSCRVSRPSLCDSRFPARSQMSSRRAPGDGGRGAGEPGLGNHEGVERGGSHRDRIRSSWTGPVPPHVLRVENEQRRDTGTVGGGLLSAHWVAPRHPDEIYMPPATGSSLVPSASPALCGFAVTEVALIRSPSRVKATLPSTRCPSAPPILPWDAQPFAPGHPQYSEWSSEPLLSGSPLPRPAGP